MFKIIIMNSSKIMSWMTPVGSLLLGGVTGFYYRDELFLPTNMRIKVAVLEYHLLSRQKLDTDLIDIVDPNSAKLLSTKSKEIIEAYEKEINE